MHREGRTGEPERARQIAAQQAYRRDRLAPDLATTLSGGYAPGFLDEVLQAMTGAIYGVEDNTAQVRIESYLCCNAATAQQVIHALATALDRAPLPPWPPVIALAGTGTQSLVQRVSLYAADQRWGSPERSVDIGTYADAPTLLAFSQARDNKQVWFDALARSQPDQVSAVMKAFPVCLWCLDLRREPTRAGTSSLPSYWPPR